MAVFYHILYRQVLRAYKKYIGDFLFFAMKLDPSLRSDKRFTAMVDDVFHMDVYVNRVMYSTILRFCCDSCSISGKICT